MVKLMPGELLTTFFTSLYTALCALAGGMARLIDAPWLILTGIPHSGSSKLTVRFLEVIFHRIKLAGELAIEASSFG